MGAKPQLIRIVLANPRRAFRDSLLLHSLSHRLFTERVILVTTKGALPP